MKSLKWNVSRWTGNVCLSFSTVHLCIFFRHRDIFLLDALLFLDMYMRWGQIISYIVHLSCIVLLKTGDVCLPKHQTITGQTSKTKFYKLPAAAFNSKLPQLKHYKKSKNQNQKYLKSLIYVKIYYSIMN